jgi:hypothetical protein
MGYSYNIRIGGFNIEPPPAKETRFRVSFSSNPLTLEGFNLPVAISTASIHLQNTDKLSSSIVVMSHLDTGASRTSLDIELAKYLKLDAVGTSSHKTAGGIKEMLDFAVDLQFPNTNLSAFINLPVGSCNLGFDINGKLNSPRNLAVLLGRDILSHWNIVWNGPTSTVFIND